MLPQRLLKLRQQKKKTQSDLAALLGISRQAYGYYEKGEREPDTKSLNILADYFEVSVDYLLGRESTGKDLNGVNVAYFGGAKEELTEEEAQRLKEELEMFRLLKEKKMKEKNNK